MASSSACGELSTVRFCLHAVTVAPTFHCYCNVHYTLVQLFTSGFLPPSGEGRGGAGGASYRAIRWMPGRLRELRTEGLLPLPSPRPQCYDSKCVGRNWPRLGGLRWLCATHSHRERNPPLQKAWLTYGQTEYRLQVSLRSRPDRHIVVFRIDTKVGNEDARTIFLDRAETPVDEGIWQEWASTLDGILSHCIEHRYGLQPTLPGIS